jgi:BMFP domain-containing protein YqiC
MFEPSTLNDLAKRLAGAVPGDLQLLKADMEKTFQAILQASFSRMNLVSREEFDVQRSVLARTREQLETLEARVAELEQRILER